MEYPFKDLQPLDEATARTGYYKDWTHIDADTFHQISELVKFIREKGYGSDTREAIAQALERVYHDATKSDNANMEVSMARKNFKNLASRLDASDSKLSSATERLAQKITKGSGQVDWADLSQSVKEDLSDGLVAVVGEKSIGTPQLIENSVTSDILSFPTNRASAPSTNRFNKDVAIIGKYVRATDGLIADGAAYSYNIVRVTPGEEVTIKTAEQVVFKDSAGMYLTGNQYLETQQTLTVPAGATQMWLNTRIEWLDVQQINSGATLLPYENYYPKVAGEDIADGSISPNKADFFENSSNLFHKDKAVIGKYIRATDGSEGTAANFSHTKIKTAGISTLTIRFKEQIAFYDTRGAFISGIDNSVGQTLGVHTFAVPPNADYMIVNTVVDYLDAQQVNIGNKLLPFEDSEKKIPERYIRPTLPARQHLEQIGSSIALGDIGRIKLLGDSITHGVGGTGWAQNGASIGGTGYFMSPNSTSWANYLRDYLADKFGTEVINWGATGRDTQWILDNKSTLIEESDDLIILMIGTNDRIEGKGDLASYRNRLTEIVDYVKSRGKQIVLMSATPATVANETNPTREFHMEDVDTAIMTVASDFNMEYISLFKCILEYCDYKNLDFNELLADGLHPNDAGYDVMYRIILKKLGIGLKIDGATW